MKIGPKYKICRRLNDRVFSKCQTTKFTVAGATPVRRTKKHGRGSLSEYNRQLLEKQKIRLTYGVSERQFANYIKQVKTIKGENHSAKLYQALEKRLDNVVFRLGLANSRLFARQLVSHGHITVNGRRLTIPSYQVRPGDQITIRPGSRQNAIFREIKDQQASVAIPTWLVFDWEQLAGEVKAEPQPGQAEQVLNFASVLEFYSRV